MVRFTDGMQHFEFFYDQLHPHGYDRVALRSDFQGNRLEFEYSNGNVHFDREPSSE